MVRTKEFDPAEALDKAIKLFWRNGYERTSVRDLVEAMGINRGSLYDTFGDKHSLFLNCLSKYSEVYVSQTLWVLSQNTPIYPTLKKLFDNVVDLVHEDQCNWGCLINNTANELSLHDKKVAELVSGIYNQFEQSFTRFLEYGKSNGELPAELDARSKGRFLTSSFVGLSTLAKTNVSSVLLKDVIQTTLSFLK